MLNSRLDFIEMKTNFASKFTIELEDLRVKIRKYEVTKTLINYYNTLLKKNLPTLPIDRLLFKT